MARYDNLKDYFQNEHIELIKASIIRYDSEHQHIGDVEKVQVQTLRCLYKKDILDTSSDIEIEAGVSAQIIYGDDKSYSEEHFFLIHISGDLKLKLSDIKVSVIKEIDRSEMPDGSIYDQFLLPKADSDDIERMYKEYYQISSGTPPTFEKILKNLQLPIYFADLDDTCLGRLNLSESDIDIYLLDETKNDLVLYSKKAIYGTIILNKRKYYEEKDGEFLITVCHELVHWQFHPKFFMILMLLGNNEEALNCKVQPPIYKDNMTDSQKALCIAEWQANELSWRIVMPEVDVKYWLEILSKIASKEIFSKYLGHEAQIYGIASHYKVSPYVVKKRLRQLGYDWADGTWIEIDGKRYPEFQFPQGTLKEDETFIIDCSNYEKLLRENEEFAELINSGRYIYIDYAVCLLDPKFVDDKNKLTDHAREHADECLIRFKYRSIENKSSTYPYKARSYLNKIPDYNAVVPESFELCKEDTGLDQATKKMIKNFNDKLNELNSDKLSTFANTVIYHMKEKEIDDKELAKRTKLSIEAIKKIYIGKTKIVDKRNVMTLCIALELDLEESWDLFKKADYDLMQDSLQNRAYRFIIKNQYNTVTECNKILHYFCQDELPYHRGQ